MTKKKEKKEEKQQYIIVYRDDESCLLSRSECFDRLHSLLVEDTRPLHKQVKVYKVAEELDVDAKLIPMLDGEEE